MISLEYPRMLLSDVVYDRLLNEIIDGRRAPGTRLNLDVLATEFGISRTPIREAVNRLVIAGFVDVARNSRTSVATWGVEDLRQRLALVVAIVTAARRRLTPLACQRVRSEAMTTEYIGGPDLIDVCRIIYTHGFNRVRAGAIDDTFDALRAFLRARGLPAAEASPVIEGSELLKSLDDPLTFQMALDHAANRIDNWLQHIAGVSPRPAAPASPSASPKTFHDEKH